MEIDYSDIKGKEGKTEQESVGWGMGEQGGGVRTGSDN